MATTATLLAVFGIFIPALILPGPDFIGVVRMAMTRGTRAGLLTSLGVSLGLGLYAMLSLLGLSAILVEYQWLTWAVRVLGSIYLIYLGIKLVLARPVRLDQSPVAQAPMQGNPLAFGFLVTLTNPKAIVLFASVFATAVTSATPSWLMLLMIGIVFASALVWYTAVTLFMSSAPVLRRFENARHWIERAAGVCFIAIGGRILLDARNPVSP
jgi:threonine/homoserine/homoserine lactone efflux protein